MVTTNALQAPRWTRRTFAGTLAAATTATVVPPAVRAGAQAAPAAGAASQSTLASTSGTAGGLRVLPPAEAPYDVAGRRELALDALTFYVRQKGNFPGRSVYQLPAAPWFGGNLDPALRYAWDMAVPGSLPLYLLAFADDSGQLDASQTTITVNGEAVADLATYVHGGVPAISYGTIRDFAVLDLVFAPPAPGRYHLEVRTRLGRYAPAASPGTLWPDETVLSYDLLVGAADALNRTLLRDSAGNTYALSGSDRRHVRDLDTLHALGFSDRDALTASPTLLAALPDGGDLPWLRDGLLVRSDTSAALFRLQGGKRQWIKNRDSVVGQDVSVVDSTVLQSIPPVLLDDMLLKGEATDVFHVDRGTLRKVPDWKWVTDKGLDPANLLYVPDRVIAALPQNSPEWRTPGGSVMDRTFDSYALGRSLVYRVFLPAGYDGADRAGQRYPVLYLLHGLSGRYDEWDGYGASEVANALAADGKFSNAIMVMPQGGLGYWINQEGGTPWADYVARDLVAHVDATYRTLPRRAARAIGGLSMGAHAAIQIALNYPDVFGVAGVHSPSIRGADTAPAYFGTGDAFARHDPLSLVQNSTLATPPQIWIDAGQNDPWRPSAELLHQALLTKGWPHEWHVYPGEHDGWYWGDHLWDYLPYYSTAFQKNGIR